MIYFFMQIPTVKAGATTRTGLQHTPHAHPPQLNPFTGLRQSLEKNFPGILTKNILFSLSLNQKTILFP